MPGALPDLEASIGLLAAVVAFALALRGRRRLERLAARMAQAEEAEKARLIHEDTGRALPHDMSPDRWLDLRRREGGAIYALILLALAAWLAALVAEGDGGGPGLAPAHPGTAPAADGASKSVPQRVLP